MRRRWTTALAVALIVPAVGCAGSHRPPNPPNSSRPASPSAGASSTGGSALASPSVSPASASSARARRHVVVVMMENRSYADIIGNHSAPYLNALARHGRSLTHFYAITHPSQPNYIALFSGSTHGVTGDSCPQRISATNLARELMDAGLTFAGYSEGLPKTGDKSCTAGRYARRHAPWTDFTDLPSRISKPFTAFPSDFNKLPTLSFVVPNLDHDMHDGTIHQADQWLHNHLGSYVRWAATHNSLLVVTWDEDDHSQGNRIPAIIHGAGVRAGTYGQRATLYSLLRSFEDLFRLHRLGASATARPIPLT